MSGTGNEPANAKIEGHGRPTPLIRRAASTVRCICGSGARGRVAPGGGASTPRAQSIEPRAYSNAPVGVNFLIAGYWAGGL